jgi:hypothetical protein
LMRKAPISRRFAKQMNEINGPSGTLTPSILVRIQVPQPYNIGESDALTY